MAPAASRSQEPAASSQPPLIRWWTIALGIALALALAGLFPWLGAWMRKPPSWSLYMPALSTALLLVLALTRMFRPTELALIFIMQLGVCGVAGSGLADTWFRVLLTKPIYHSDDGLRALGEAYPAALSLDPHSATAAELAAGMRRGGNAAAELTALTGSLWEPVLIGALVMMGGLAIVLGLIAATHRQWTQHERLQHPLAEVSGTLCDGTFLGRAFLIATAVAMLPWVWDVLVKAGWNPLPLFDKGSVHPETPRLAYRIDELAGLFGVQQPDGSWPLSAWCTIEWKAFAVGLAFLLVPAIGFSVWSGFWLSMLVCGWLYAAGIPIMYMEDGRALGGGAMVAFAGIVLWLGRHHYLALLRAAVAGGPDAGDRLGVIGLRVALIASLGVGVALSWIGGHWAAGIVGVLIVWLFLIVLARVVAESGLIAFQTAQDVVPFAYACGLPAMLPLQAMFAALWLGQTLCGDTRTSLAGLGAHATGLAERERVGVRRALIAIAVILPLVLACALASRLVSGWTLYGQVPTDLAWQPDALKSVLARVADGGAAMQPHILIIGAGLVVLAVAVRRVFPGSPFHPVGLVAAFCPPVWGCWSSLALGWAVKVLVLRWGGMGLYALLRPAAMGLIVGDCVGMSVQSLAKLWGIGL